MLRDTIGMPLLASAPPLGDALLETIGRLHPVAVHMPLGLVLAAALVEVARGIQGRRGNSPFTPVALALAAAFAWVAVASGWLLAEKHGGGDALFWHRWLGIATAVGLAPLAWTAWRASNPADRAAQQLAPLVRAGAVAFAVAVAWVGHLGGGMTWGENFALRPLMAWWRGAEAPATGGERAAEGGGGAASVGAEGGAAEQAGGVPSTTTGGVANSATGAGGGARLVVFTRDVLPILEARCYECHARGKHKGDLALDDPSSLLGQNDEGRWIVKPGDAAASLLIERVRLPAGHDDAMPPKGERLTEEQVDILRAWIRNGAPLAAGPADSGGAPGFGTNAGGENGPASGESGESGASGASWASPARTAGAAPGSTASGDVPRAARPIEWPTAPAPGLTAEARRAMAELQARGVVAQPLSLRDGWLEINASSRGAAFGDADLVLVAPLAPWVVELNVARTGVTDQGLALLPPLSALAVLRLDGTAASDAGVGAILRGAPSVQAINLVETRVTDATARRLAGLERLRSVYLWGTAVTEAPLRELAQARPAAVVHAGRAR
jgi:uncharacterized membrane protein